MILFVPLPLFFGINASCSDCRQRFATQRAATRRNLFALWWKQMVVHRDHHRNEHHRVVEEVNLHSKLRKQRLQETHGHGRAKPEVMCQRLPLQNRVLDVMPELNHEGDSPPFTLGPRKSLPQRPDADEHHDRVSVVQHFRTNEPRKE
jgi:hypothetical protein